jgi:hypothetical protein
VSVIAESERAGPVGDGVVVRSVAPNARFKFYTADRPAQSTRLRAAEISLDVSITLARPLRAVWPVFKDFNLWMNRFGYFWDRVPADSEDRFVHLGSKAGINDLTHHAPPERRAQPTRYIVRQVIEGRLIYFDSLPMPIATKDGKEGTWTGHNLFSLHEEGGHTRVAIFMEHTWYSESMTTEELREEGQRALDAGLEFWREFFIPDLVLAVESSPNGLTRKS